MYCELVYWHKTFTCNNFNDSKCSTILINTFNNSKITILKNRIWTKVGDGYQTAVTNSSVIPLCYCCRDTEMITIKLNITNVPYTDTESTANAVTRWHKFALNPTIVLCKPANAILVTVIIINQSQRKK